jgi:alginate O-acetyltransferase complex protein AlgI
LVAWTGWIGLLLLLHFGLFEVLALVWQAQGVEASPLMRSPFLARSLGEFWGRRWNVAFHELTLDLVYRPLRARLGTGAATLIAFAASGLLHDLVISLPARGGWGLPTGYFLLQAAGVALERSAAGRRLDLDRPLLSRAFIAACAAAPAFLLFHPPFMERVVLPFLEAIGELASVIGTTGPR